MMSLRADATFLWHLIADTALMPVPHRQLLLLNVCLNSLRHSHSIRISLFVQFRVRTGRARRDTGRDGRLRDKMMIRDATDVTARDPTSVNRRES